MQRVLETIREEFKKGIKTEFDPEYTKEVMSIYDRATALALGKRFLSDKPAMRELREHPTLRSWRIHKHSQSTTNTSVQDVLDACRKSDSHNDGLGYMRGDY